MSLEPGQKEALQKAIDRSERVDEQAKKGSQTLLQQTVFLGTLGVLFVVPVIGGVYLGNWLDDRLPGYSARATLGLLVLGMFVGGVNVYFFIKKHW